MNGLAVISCGSRKGGEPAQARTLYTGGYFLNCRAAAEALLPSRGWLILSALHGLVRPAEVIAPYNLRMGQPGSVGVEKVKAQAEALGVDDADPVIVFAGQAYARVLREVWPRLVVPIAGMSMGNQRAYMRRVAATRSLP